jgi:hypothetical protein
MEQDSQHGTHAGMNDITAALRGMDMLSRYLASLQHLALASTVEHLYKSKQ